MNTIIYLNIIFFQNKKIKMQYDIGTLQKEIKYLNLFFYIVVVVFSLKNKLLCDREDVKINERD